MIGIATAATYLTLGTCVWSVLAMWHGLRARDARWIQSGRRAVVATCVLVWTATAILLYALATDMWEVEYVWRTSLPQQPTIYKIGALWGGMSGSVLFWLAILSLCGPLLVWQSARQPDWLSNHALVVVSIVTLFFAVLVAGLIPGVTNPFALLRPEHRAAIASGQAVRGMGLNPLLQTPLMLLHPPNLYAGFVVTTVPFAYAVGALASGTGGSNWIVRSRRWTLAAWFFLTMGNLIGGAWAYGELGWGGYWGWDPVENSALLPWLTITAFLHSVMIQEHRNMLKLWNIFLIALTFLLTLFGTMLVRSGVLSSVHAFAQSKELLWYFVVFMLLTTGAVIRLVAKRRRQLASLNSFDSLLSRESAFLMNNWVFVLCAVVVFAGTTFPVASSAYYQWVHGVERKIAVSEPFYNTFIVPIGMILLLLTGIGPMIAWKRATPSNLRRNFLVPATAGLVAALVSVYPFYRVGRSDPTGFPVLPTIYAVLCVYASVFVMATVVVELQKGMRVRRRRGAPNAIAALADLVARNKRRYGGYIVHVGIVLFYVGVLGSKGFQVSHRQILRPGETYSIAGYTLDVGQPFEERGPNATFAGINLTAKRNGKAAASLRPARGFYDNNEQPTYEAAILRRFGGDLYIALGELTQDGRADIQIYYNPLAWVVLWLAPLVLIVGTGVCIAERTRERPTAQGEYHET
jgi:cytochrome c-type biogenesis protein CcmF